MADPIEVSLQGAVTTSVLVNLRQGAPSTSAPVVRKLGAGVVVPVAALVVGEAVQGNAHWYRTAEGPYVWAGACGPFQPAGSGAPSGLNQTPMVVDLSHWDSVSDLAAAKAAGVVGVIHKATTGSAGVDDAYARRRDLAKAAGLLWGAYHWGTHAPVDAQVQHFLDVAQPDAETLVALDFEAMADNQMTVQDARGFLQGVEAKLGRKAVLYSGDLIKTGLGSSQDAFFGGHRLWLAQYGDSPSVQASWSAYWLWQYTDGTHGPGVKTVPGIPGDSQGRLDCDHFPGDADTLKAQWAS